MRIMRNDDTEPRHREGTGARVFERAHPLRATICAALEVGIVSFIRYHGKVDVGPVVSPLVVHALRKRVGSRSSVLINQTTKIAESLSAAKGPERFLAEVQRHATSIGARIDECCHSNWLNVAKLRWRGA